MGLPAGGLWLDAQGAQNRSHFDRGIPRYVSEQLAAVLALAPAAVGTVALNAAQPLSYNLSSLLGSHKAQLRTVRDAPPPRRPELYHVMSPFELDRSQDELLPAWARSRDIAKVVTLFDLIPLVFADHYLRDPIIRARFEARATLVRGADRVLAISETTAADAARLLNVPDHRITVIDAGVSTAFADRAPTPAAALGSVTERFERLRPGYMLYVAGIEFRKNISQLIVAYSRMDPATRAAHQLVLTCKVTDDQRAALAAETAAAGLRPDEVLITGYVTDEELAALYRAARLFVFASFYEGSGLPILEAMALGLPVAAANTSTSPEILGDLDATFDPHDPDDIARVLSATVTDDDVLHRLRERSARRVGRYTWEHVGRQTLEGYEQTLAERSARRRRTRGVTKPRIAMLTPWPPEQSGIADYNAALVPHLARFFDVDVVVGGDRDDYREPDGGRLVTYESHEWWSRQLSSYEHVVYCMGNSHFHVWIYEAMARRPGILYCHDVRLTGFYGVYSGLERDSDPAGRLGERLDAMYGWRLDVGEFRKRPPTPEEQQALGLFMTHEVQEYAHRILVHSEFAADIMRLDRPHLRPIDAPIHVVPLAMPPALPSTRAPFEDPLVVSFGVLSYVKGLEALLQGFALVLERHPTARLILAGSGDEGEQLRWIGLAERLGIGDRVGLAGYVDDNRYRELLAQATVAVQLRLTTNGEASAAVADTMAAGVPTVVTDVGWFSELADDAVVKVPFGAGPSQVANAIESIVSDPDRARAVAGAGRREATLASREATARHLARLLRDAPPPEPPPALLPAPVTVVVTTVHGRLESLMLCLRTLADQTARDFAVVISDQGARDGTRAEVEHLARTDVWSGRLAWTDADADGSSISRTRNVGAAAAAPGTELVVILDVDVLLEPEAIERFGALHRSLPAAVIYGSVQWLEPMTHSDVTRALDSGGIPGLSTHIPAAAPVRVEGTIVGPEVRPADAFAPHDVAVARPTDPALALGGLLAVPSAIWDRLGGFDESLDSYGYDETEFAVRCARADIPMVLVSDVIGHHIWHGKSDWAELQMQTERNLDAILRRYGLDVMTDVFADWSVWWHYHRDREGTLERDGETLWAIDRGRRFRLRLPTADWLPRLGFSQEDVAPARALDTTRDMGEARALPLERRRTP